MFKIKQSRTYPCNLPFSSMVCLRISFRFVVDFLYPMLEEDSDDVKECVVGESVEGVVATVFAMEVLFEETVIGVTVFAELVAEKVCIAIIL